MKGPMIDYAEHLIKIETLARRASDQCLGAKYEDASNTALEIGAESRLLVHALTAMMQNQKILATTQERWRNHPRQDWIDSMAPEV
jgi:hypothetical protein